MNSEFENALPGARHAARKGFADTLKDATGTPGVHGGAYFGTLKWPGSDRLRTPQWMLLLNKVLGKLRIPLSLRRSFDHRKDMVSLEQASNLQVLLKGVLDVGVPGAVVELGCHTGATTVILAEVIRRGSERRPLHVYDTFIGDWSSIGSVREQFEGNMKAFGLPLPEIHDGDVRTTVPAELPDAIAFAHIDLGVGGDRVLNRALVHHALSAIYPRLSRHAVLVLMDLHLPGVTTEGNDSNPGVRDACEAFFHDKPEPLMTPYGGPCSHGFIRKA